MRRELFVGLCVTVFAAVCAPALAQYGVPVQCESIIDLNGNILAPWTQTISGTGIQSAVSRFGVNDLYAYGGGAFQINDDLTADDSAKIFIRNVSTTPFNGVATAVVRMKVTDEVAFTGNSAGDPSSSNVWSRNFILSLYNSALTSSRKGIALAVRPDVAAIINNNSTTLYGTPNKVWGDNTQWVKWTIVAYHNGSANSGNLKFDLYRNGVLASQLTTYTMNSSLETPLRDGYTNGFDGVVLMSGPNGATGSWKFDYVAYKAGADPTWDPIPDTQTITGVVKDSANPSIRIPNATVWLGNGKTTTSDANGVYTFTNCGPDVYKIGASAEGYFSASGEVGLPYNTPTVVHDIELMKIPTPATPQVVYDTFSRMTWQELGTTEDAGAYPWDITDEIDTASVSEQLLLAPKWAHGVSISGGFTPANIDYSIDLGPIVPDPNTGDHHGGISYRQAALNVYDVGDAGYYLWFPADGSAANLWRAGMVYSAPTAIDWNVAHRVRVIAYGNYHEVLVDGKRVLSTVHDGKIGGGYVGVMRHQADLKADNLNIIVLGDATGLGTVSGVITDAANPAVTVGGAVINHSDGRSITADSNGAYSFPLNSPDRQTITVRAAGYLAKTVSIVPTLGANVVNVALDADTNYQATIAAAKQMTDGTTVSLFGKVITAQWGGQTMNVEEPDRSSGIKVSVPYSSTLSTKIGKTVGIIGTVESDPLTGERYIDATNWYETSSSASPLRPVFANSRALADRTAGLDMTGLYVKTIGKVTSVDTATRSFIINDGGLDVKVVADPSITILFWPAVGDTIAVDGIASLDGTTPETAVRTVKPWNGDTNLLASVANWRTSTAFNNPGIEGTWGPYDTGCGTFNTPGHWGVCIYNGAGVTAVQGTDNPHGGSSFAKFSNTTGCAPNVYGRLFQLPGAVPGYYEFSCWVRGVDVSDAGGCASHWIDWNNMTWALNVPSGTYDWKRIQTTFYVYPWQTYMNIGLNVVNTCTELSVDDVMIRPAGGFFTWVSTP